MKDKNNLLINDQDIWIPRSEYEELQREIVCLREENKNLKKEKSFLLKSYINKITNN